MSISKRIGALLITLLVTSLCFGVCFTMYDALFGYFASEREVDWEGIVTWSYVASFFIALSYIIFAIPALLLARQIGWANPLWRLLIVGATVGCLSSSLMSGIMDSGYHHEVFVLFGGIGALCGITSSVCWWLLRESKKVSV